jgi:hypothetical protein
LIVISDVAGPKTVENHVLRFAPKLQWQIGCLHSFIASDSALILLSLGRGFLLDNRAVSSLFILKITYRFTEPMNLIVYSEHHCVAAEETR